MDRKRKLPDLEFVTVDLEMLQITILKSAEAFLGRTLGQGDPVRLFVLWLVDILHQHRININETAKQNIPRFAKGQNLDELGALFHDITRLAESFATTTLRFTLSAPQISAWTAPKGTRATPGNQIYFETIEELQIPPGEVVGIVKAVCKQSGEIGNGFLPGEIMQGVDILPFQQKVENVTTSEGGADIENDDSFYERMQQAMEEFSTAGPEGAYKAHAKKASQLIGDVATSSPMPGIADIRVLLKNGKIPGTEIINAVYEQLSADTVRPFTDYVQVSAPDIVKFSVDCTYYTYKHSDLSLAEISKKVEGAVGQYLQWQTETIGRDINPSILTSLLMGTGIKRVEIREPVFRVLETIQVAQMEDQELIVIDGGSEDE